MKLDIGCGNTPKGDVNIDLFTEATGHRTGRKGIIGYPLNPKTIKNFVKADAQHLPFQNEVFDIAYSCHVIEHIPNPEKMLNEMLRVTKTTIRIKCPHRLGEAHSDFHLHKFKSTWFFSYAYRKHLHCRIAVTDWRYFPHTFFSIVRLPKELTVIMTKTAK